MDERYRLPRGSGVTPPPIRRDRSGRRRGMMGGVTEAPIDPGSDAQAERSDDAPLEPTGTGRRVDRSLILLIALLGVGAFFLVRGVLVGITGDERVDLPTFVESVDPVPEAVQVLNQSNVFVDLATGYTGVLVIDGTELETQNVDELGRVDIELGQQVDLPPVTIFEPGNSTLTFTPNAGAPISQFLDGEHIVEVIYWRIDESRQRARSFTWSFTVV